MTTFNVRLSIGRDDMATKIKIELDHDGIRELLCSAPIANECEKAAQKIANVAGDGFEVTKSKQVGFGGGRVGVGVEAATREARLAESEDKVLSRAVSQCRS